MLDLGRSSRWYGKLETSTRFMLVIFDPKLPPAPTGQVYLFNAERGAIVQYMWSVVSERLRDLTAEEQKAAQGQLEQAWKTARRNFLKVNQHLVFAKERPAKVAAKRHTDEEEEDTEEFEQDSVEFGEEE